MKYAVVRDAATSALAKVTANLRPDHYGTLPGDTIPSLCKALDWANSDAKLVILNALAVIGDGRAIASVERLERKPPTPDVGTAASDLLPILRHRDMESKAPTQLLRSSIQANEGEQELLRAAASASADDPDMLLRAAGAEKE